MIAAVTPVPSLPSEAAPARIRADSLALANLYGFIPPAALAPVLVYEPVNRAPDAVAAVRPIVRTRAIPDPGGRAVDVYA